MLAEQLLRALGRQRAGFRCDLIERRAFLDNLIFVYHVIVASEELLRRGIGRLRYGVSVFEGDLLWYYQQHLEEEARHAEWLAEDIRAAGVDVATLPINQIAAEAVGAQYYLIEHAHPCLLLGYMAFLECFPMPLELVELLEQAHGKESMRTLRLHAEVDPTHGVEVINMLNRVPNGWREAVFNNGVRTAELFGRACANFGKGV